MSQAKVDNYKKNKANRQKMMKKEKLPASSGNGRNYPCLCGFRGMDRIFYLCESGKSTGHYAGNCRI